MKKLPLLVASLCASAWGLAGAQTSSSTGSVPTPIGSTSAPVEVGQVISSTPVIQQFPVQRRVCSDEEVLVQQPKTGAGAAIGAVAGGVLGTAIGNGAGPATVLGAIGGAVIGDSAEQPTTRAQNIQRCTTQTTYENRVVGYNVVYSYAGKQYSAQMPYDPGPTLALHVGPAVQAPVMNTAPAVTETTTVYTTPAPTTTTVVVSPPMVPGPYFYTWPYVVVPGPGPRHHGPWMRHP